MVKGNSNLSGEEVNASITLSGENRKHFLVFYVDPSVVFFLKLNIDIFNTPI